MDTLRADIMAIPGWADLRPADLARRLNVWSQRVRHLLKYDTELAEARAQAQEMLLASIREKITAIPGWENLQITTLVCQLQVPWSKIQIALHQLKGTLPAPSPDGPRDKCKLKRDAFVHQVEAVPNWTLCEMPKLAKVLGLSTETLATRIHYNPRLHQAWKRDKPLRVAKLRQERALRLDFRKIENWETLPPKDLAVALKTRTSDLYAALRHNPEKREAWNKRAPYIVPPKRKCEFENVPGWQTMRMEDIAKAMGISRFGFTELLKRKPDMERRFNRGYRGFSKWNPESIAAAHSRCKYAEDAAREFNVGVTSYQRHLLLLGIPALPSRKLRKRVNATERLKNIPGWQDMSNAELSRHLGWSASRVNLIIRRHPELLAQYHPKPDRLKGYVSKVPRIMAVPGWETITLRELQSRTGIHINKLTILVQCVPQLFERRSPWKTKPWTTLLEDIQSVPDWQRKTLKELAHCVNRSTLHIRYAIAETPALRDQWRPKPPGNGNSPLQDAILAIPGWRKKTAKEIMHILGRTDIASARRCLRRISAIERQPPIPSTPGALSTSDLRHALGRIPHWPRCDMTYLASAIGMDAPELERRIADDGELAYTLAEDRRVTRRRLLYSLRKIPGWKKFALRTLAEKLKIPAKHLREAILSDTQAKAEWKPPSARRPWNHALLARQAA